MPKAKLVLKKLLNIGFKIVHQTGSHRKLRHADGRQLIFAYHDNVDLGRVQIANVAKDAGVKPEDLV